jgi:hypothetical protein
VPAIQMAPFVHYVLLATSLKMRKARAAPVLLCLLTVSSALALYHHFVLAVQKDTIYP